MLFCVNKCKGIRTEHQATTTPTYRYGKSCSYRLSTANKKRSKFSWIRDRERWKNVPKQQVYGMEAFTMTGCFVRKAYCMRWGGDVERKNHAEEQHTQNTTTTTKSIQYISVDSASSCVAHIKESKDWIIKEHTHTHTLYAHATNCII